MTLKTTCGLLLLTIISANAENITGTWKTTMVDPPLGSPLRPMDRYEPLFEFRVNGEKLEGRALIATYPRNAVVWDGRIEGNHFTFRVIHEYGRTNLLTGQIIHTAFKCVGTIQGDELDLTIIPINDDGSEKPDRTPYRLRGTRN